MDENKKRLEHLARKVQDLEAVNKRLNKKLAELAAKFEEDRNVHEKQVGAAVASFVPVVSCGF